MADLSGILGRHVSDGAVPGAVGLVVGVAGPRWRPSAQPAWVAPP